MRHRRLTGFSIGKGKISARLYDKPLEILTSSGKVWMYDVWGIERVPDGKRIIRVEFQLRREGLKELDISLSGDLFGRVKHLWAYLTQEWLKVQSGPGKHHTQRKTVAWWKVVQDGFEGALTAHPLIRAKAIRADRVQILRQLYGSWVSMIALDSQGRKPKDEHTIELERQVVDLLDAAEEIGLNDAEVTRRVEERLAKFQRERRKNAEAVYKRRALGISSGVPGHERSAP